MPLNQPGKMAEWLERFLPRSKSKAVFILTLSFYGIACNTISVELIRVFGLWPMKVDPVTHARRGIEPGVDGSTIFDFFLSPLVESLILIGIIELLRRLKFGNVVQVMVSTVLICASHSAMIPIWGLLVFPSFLIDTGAYLYWRRDSFWVAAQVLVVVHFCINLPAFLAVVRRALHVIN